MPPDDGFNKTRRISTSARGNCFFKRLPEVLVNRQVIRKIFLCNESNYCADFRSGRLQMSKKVVQDVTLVRR